MSNLFKMEILSTENAVSKEGMNVCDEFETV